MFQKRSNQSAASRVFSLDALERRVLLSGDLDPTFGFGGLVQGPTVLDPSTSNIPGSYSAVVTSSDRKVIVGGIATSSAGQEYYFTRYNVDGSPDSTFGTLGATEVSFGAQDIPTGQNLKLMIEPDGKIIAAGNLGDGTNATAFGVARLNADGTLDTTFGDSGTLVVQGDKNAVPLWQDGELLIGSNNTIRRFNDNGTIDSTFATGLPGGATFAVQSDGKVVEGVNISSNGNTAIHRYTLNGSIDTTFGTDGVAALAQNSSMQDMVVEPGGTIVSMIYVEDFAPAYEAVYDMTALNANGSTDTSFGTNGSVTAASGDDENILLMGGLVQQPNGQLLAVVSFSFTFSSSDYAQISRYSANGALDTSFGNDGSTKVGSIAGKYASNLVSVQSIAALDNAGRLLLVGGYGFQASGSESNIVAVQTTGTAVPGPATQVIVQTQPTNGFTNDSGIVASFGLEDANGALAISDTSNFTVFVSGGTAAEAGQMDSITTAAQGGFVDAGPFAINTPGTGYKLTISGETPSITTTPFNIVSPQVFAQVPSGNVAAGKLPPVVVDVINLDGEVDTTSNSPVDIFLVGNAGTATLSGTTEVSAINGVATFNDLSITTPGTAYTLGLGFLVSNPFNVIDEHLAFSTPPTAVITPGNLGSVAVEILDGNNNLVTAENSNVTLTLSGGPTGAVLGGTATVAAVNGVATFSDLTLSTVGNQFTLTATDASGLTATSSSFNVVPQTTPSALAPTLGSTRLASENIAGTKLAARLPVTVTNSGDSALKGNTTINVYADTGSILDGEQVLVTSFKRVPTPKSGKKQLIDLDINSLPKTLPAGVYHLLVQIVDPTGATSVVATDQTVTVVALVIQPTVTVTPVTSGNTAKRGTVLVTVTNGGNIAAKGVDISLMTTPQGNGPITTPLATLKSSATLKPNASKKFVLHFKRTSESATYYPFAWVTLDGVSPPQAGETLLNG